MRPDPLKQPHAAEPGDVLSVLGVDRERGLDDAEVRKRRQRYGPNALERRGHKTVWTILKNQFESLIVWLLAGASVLSFALGDLAEGVAILVVLAINTAIGFITEWRAARSMEALYRITEVTASVRRGGTVQKVQARDLVPGDIVALGEGDVVSADARLIETDNLQIDESALTGESAPVTKSAERIDADATLADRTDMAFKGTAVTRGNATCVVVATGRQTELGEISTLAESAQGEVSPLERRLDQLGGRLVWWTLALAGSIAGIGFFHGTEIDVIVKTAVALAVAAVPEGLPVVATLALARGMIRMARRNALVEQLSAVETLGATTVILTDKTGTLTENRMHVAEFVLPEDEVRLLRGDDSAPFRLDDSEIRPDDHPPLAAALEVGALCSNAELDADGPDGAGTRGDPMEVALLEAARRAGRSREDLLDAQREVREIPFDSEINMMATVHESDGRYRIAVKGAPEAMIACAATVFGANGPQPLEDRQRDEWRERLHAAAGRGYRLIGLGQRFVDDEGAEPYEDMTLIGLVCLIDPVRGDVPAAISSCRQAGVRVVMVTGDHVETARQIAAEAGLGEDNEIIAIEGSELSDVDPGAVDSAMRERIRNARVFARVTPRDKLEIVRTYQAAGDIVAMTGDGVNDAPALKKADIGIAMGQRGTQVAREAAQIVLKDDAFPTITMAIEQGRVIFGNIRQFVIYLLSGNFGQIIVVGLVTLIGLPLPLLPLQILYLNLVNDVFPALALGMGEGDKRVMQRPPRDTDEPIIARTHWVRIALFGLFVMTAPLSGFLLALYGMGLATSQAVTVSFTTLALGRVWHVFNMREPTDAGLKNEITTNPYVWGAIVICLVLVSAALFLPGLAPLLGLPFPGWPALAMALGLSLLPLSLGQLWLLLWAGRQSRKTDRAAHSGTFAH